MMNKLGNKSLDIYVIAEIGFNHEGDIDTAAEMIGAAAKAGANAVKFQTFKAADLALSSNPHFDIIKCGEMSLEQHVELLGIANEHGVDLLSTPYSPWAVDLLEEVGVSSYKVASMDCTNKHLLKYIAQTEKQIYLSTGMASVVEIADTLEYLRSKNSGPVVLMHCMSLYPAAAEQLNLDIITFLKEVFGIPVGYSDHYPGTTACLAASILGAEVIETHFTLDSSKKGGDHYHSVEPEALSELVSDIKTCQLMLGDKTAIFSRPDGSYAAEFRRGLYSRRALKKGTVLKEEDLLFCRPTSELSPSDLEWMEGRVLNQDIGKHVPVLRKYIDG